MASDFKSIEFGQAAKKLEFGDVTKQLVIKVYGRSETRDTESLLLVTVNAGVDPDPSGDNTAGTAVERLMRPGDKFEWDAGEFAGPGTKHDIRAVNMGSVPLIIEAYDE